MRKIKGLERGMGIGGWLTNYKRFNVLPKDKRYDITIGDMEHFATYITKNDVEYIASLGFDHIRLGFDQIVVEQKPYKYNKEIICILHDFVSWCNECGIRPVLNMHKAIGNYCDILEEKGLMQSEKLKKRFCDFWEMMEIEFSKEQNVVFEILNEVVCATADEWNSLAQMCIDSIRKHNKQRLIVVGTTEWNSPPGLCSLKVFDDENVIYTFHCYEPYEFTHQRGVLQAASLYYNREMPYPCDDIERYREFHRLVHGKNDAYKDRERIDIEFLRMYLNPVKDFIKNHPDKILWCGEFGTIRHCKIEYRENWMNDMIKILKEWDIPYCVWNYLSTPNDGNRFSLVDDDNRQILSERMNKILLGDVN